MPAGDSQRSRPETTGGGWRANIAPAKARAEWARDGHAFAAPVGSFPAGASPYGALDMAGNVWEWCHDWYARAHDQSAPRVNPTGPGTGSERVLRGGSFSNGANTSRCTNRLGKPPSLYEANVGFRVVMTLE